jgi:hypothetical protein
MEQLLYNPLYGWFVGLGVDEAACSHSGAATGAARHIRSRAGGTVDINAGAWAMRSMLLELKPGDPGVFVAVAVDLIAIELLGSYAPARRATKVGPVSV